MSAITVTSTSRSETIIVAAPDLRTLIVGGEPDLAADDAAVLLGEPRLASVLRNLHGNRDAKRLVLQIPHGSPDTSGSDELMRGLRRWCEARIERNRAVMAGIYRTGWRALAVCLALLAASLVLGSLLESDAITSNPSLLRRTLGEGIIIAGWVFLWRPIEMLMFDGLPQREECRLLRRLLALEWIVEMKGCLAGSCSERQPARPTDPLAAHR